VGALDFAGGTVVHINSGIAGLVGAYLIGKRDRLRQGSADARTTCTLTMIGARCCGPAGSASTPARRSKRGNRRALAFINTYLATALRGARVDARRAMFKGKPSMLGAASGAVAGSSRSRRPPATSASRARS
jgi:Amt family ammonium transporter